MFELMILPFLICLILTGIYTYFGLHVVQRGVIFVDIALAQMIALGGACALLLGIDLNQPQVYLFAVGFALLGAVIFTMTKTKQARVPQEAIIGIVYVVSTAAAILVLNYVPEGAEHIKEMLVGGILFATPKDVLLIFILSLVVGLFHLLYRERFLLVSFSSDSTCKGGISIRLWDFLFYLTFGLIVTVSVRIVVVLLIFSYLIIPAVVSILLANGFGKRLIIGWIIGILASIIGLYASCVFDFSTGASIVCSFGLVLVIVTAAKKLLVKR
ncbi:metal ABC transporter permease [bacterium]|nr:metal ABC transporter permease [bacterium]MBU1752725.1 metal ABC transporter permease [bacterium]